MMTTMAVEWLAVFGLSWVLLGWLNRHLMRRAAQRQMTRLDRMRRLGI